MAKALNPISVAFFVLFVGIGVDLALQFSVAYRVARPKQNRGHINSAENWRRAIKQRGFPKALPSRRWTNCVAHQLVDEKPLDTGES
jgi:hypothetical protein